MDSKKILTIFTIVLSLLVYWGGKYITKSEQKHAPLEDESFVNFIMPKIKEYAPGLFLWDRKFVDKSIQPEEENTEQDDDFNENQSIDEFANEDVPQPIPNPQNNIAGGIPVNPAAAPPFVGPGGPVPPPGNPRLPRAASENSVSRPNRNGRNLPKDEAINTEEGIDNNEGIAENNLNDTDGERLAGNNIVSPLDASDESKDDLVDTPNTPSPLNDKKKQKEELSVAEWEEKLLTQANNEAMDEFVKEYRSGKVKKEVFYKVINDLIHNQTNPYMQNLMIYGLASTPSSESLSMLLENKGTLQGETNEYYKVAIDSYAKEDKIKILGETLKSGKKEVVVGVIPLIVSVGTKFSSWTADFSSESSPSGNQRDRRGHANRIQRNDIVEIIDTLNKLMNSEDSLVASSARDALFALDYHGPTTPSQF